MAKRKRITISQIQNQVYCSVTKRQIIEGSLEHLPKEKRTGQQYARKLLAIEIRNNRWFKGPDGPEKARVLILAVEKILKSKKMRQEYQKAVIEKLRKGLTTVPVLFGNLIISKALILTKENYGFKTYDQTAQKVLNDSKVRAFFGKVLMNITAEGPGIERRGHKERIYELLRRRKNPLVIDVGISEGIAIQAIANFLKKKKPGAKIIGVDILVQKAAVQRGKEHGFKVLEKNIVKAPVIPRGKPKADLVRMSRILRYLTRTEQRIAIQNALKDLKIGGYLFIGHVKGVYRKVSATRVEVVE